MAQVPFTRLPEDLTLLGLIRRLNKAGDLAQAEVNAASTSPSGGDSITATEFWDPDNTNDLGYYSGALLGNRRPRFLNVGTAIRIGLNAASGGELRLKNNSGMKFRNDINTGDVYGIGVGGGNIVLIADSGAAGVRIGAATTINADLLVNGAVTMDAAAENFTVVATEADWTLGGGFFLSAGAQVDLEGDGAVTLQSNVLDATVGGRSVFLAAFGASPTYGLSFSGDVISDFNPADASFHLGDQTHRWSRIAVSSGLTVWRTPSAVGSNVGLSFNNSSGGTQRWDILPVTAEVGDTGYDLVIQRTDSGGTAAWLTVTRDTGAWATVGDWTQTGSGRISSTLTFGADFTPASFSTSVVRVNGNSVGSYFTIGSGSGFYSVRDGGTTHFVGESYGAIANFVGRYASNTLAVPQYPVSGVTMMQFLAQAYSEASVGFNQVSRIQWIATETHAVGARGTKMRFQVTPAGSTTITAIAEIQETGLQYSTDNTFDHGSSGAQRPRAGFHGSGLVVGRTLTSTLTLATGDCMMVAVYYTLGSGGSLVLSGDATLLAA